MRKVLFVLAILSLAFGVAGAKDFQKYSCSELITFDSGSRQGGDTMETATVIDGFPFSSAGSTVGLTNDYDVACPWGGVQHQMLFTLSLLMVIGLSTLHCVMVLTMTQNFM